MLGGGRCAGILLLLLRRLRLTGLRRSGPWVDGSWGRGWRLGCRRMGRRWLAGAPLVHLLLLRSLRLLLHALGRRRLVLLMVVVRRHVLPRRRLLLLPVRLLRLLRLVRRRRRMLMVMLLVLGRHLLPGRWRRLLPGRLMLLRRRLVLLLLVRRRRRMLLRRHHRPLHASHVLLRLGRWPGSRRRAGIRPWSRPSWRGAGTGPPGCSRAACMWARWRLAATHGERPGRRRPPLRPHWPAGRHPHLRRHVGRHAGRRHPLRRRGPVWARPRAWTGPRSHAARLALRRHPRRRRSPAMGRLLLVPRRLRARWPPAAALRVHPRRLLPLRRRRQLLLLRRGLVVGRRGLARAGRAVAARLLPHLLADAHQEGRQAADGASAALV
mmetsp:Transcript_9574/g.24356  ORF Transcript_9574/g.24356 Transcript_9574/m.24356 type:complete len:381 (+) Transcript_9574:162-1304(+)